MDIKKHSNANIFYAIKKKTKIFDLKKKLKWLGFSKISEIP